MAGPRARSTQNRWSSVHTEPCHPIVAKTGAAAASASPAQGHDRRALLAPTMPALTTPIANSAARAGGDWITRTSSRETYGAKIATAATTSVTPVTMTMATHRRTVSSSSGNTTYSWASTAIDQNDWSGVGAPTRFCTSRPLTTTDFTSGTPCPGGGTTSHATARLKASAA